MQVGYKGNTKTIESSWYIGMGKFIVLTRLMPLYPEPDLEDENILLPDLQEDKNSKERIHI